MKQDCCCTSHLQMANMVMTGLLLFGKAFDKHAVAMKPIFQQLATKHDAGGARVAALYGNVSQGWVYL